MVYLVTNALKKKLVYILEDILSEHPIFSSKTKVYTKFPQEERPKIAVIVRSVSGSSQKISLNNILGVSRGYSLLANFKGSSGNSIEWVKDDQENLDKLSPPGIYVVRITNHKKDSNDFEFYVDPYLSCENEEVSLSVIRGKQGCKLKNFPVNQNSESVFSQSHQFDLKKDIDYTIDYETGEIIFNENVINYQPILVDYNFRSNELGPFSTEYFTYNNTAIPGVVIAFGDRLKVGDEQVVIVENEDVPVSKVFGGIWSLNVDIICVAQDSDQQERVIDYIVTSLWAQYQDELTNEGISIQDFSLGGESEDLELEVAEEYNYSGGISFTAEVQWEVNVPIISKLKRVNFGYGEESFKENINDITEEHYNVSQYDARMNNSGHQNGLQIVPSLDSYRIMPDPWPRTSRK